jgi:hypothetical protein
MARPMKITNATHGQLASIRRERRQATQVGIRRTTKSGTPAKAISLYVDADKVDETIARLERLNPGSRYTA